MRADALSKAFAVLTGHLDTAIGRTNQLALRRGLDNAEPTDKERAALAELWAEAMKAAEPVALELSHLAGRAAAFLGSAEGQGIAAKGEELRAAIAVADRKARLEREQQADREYRGEA